MLFQAVMKFLSRLVEFKILVNWGIVMVDFTQDRTSYRRQSRSGNYAEAKIFLKYREIFPLAVI